MNPADPTLPAIDVSGLDCGYDGQVLLKNLNFQVKRGEIFFVIGGSGCGKSTLLRHLIGLNLPTAGTVKFFGECFNEAAGERQREMLKRIGVLYQGGALWSSLSLLENVMLPLEEYTPLNPSERAELACMKLSQVGLSGYDAYYPSEISGGMKKRAGLARALALDPAIVFFDEPSAGLDPLTSRRLDELIVTLRDLLGMTCVVVSHELASIFAIADRVIMLDKQEKGIIANGDPRVLVKESKDLRVREFLGRGEDAMAGTRQKQPSP
ncbi:MAG: ATP-binding cassette domain-containing protein [Opitutaceae bacterium]|jgi:phospholipid/cholesterol/gamma-HCH transport system ATP-binding protein